MKAIEKKQAINLRYQGYSIKDISKTVGVAKSSVSLWVRDIELSEEQRAYLKVKGLLREEIERRRTTRLRNEQAKRDIVINEAAKSIPRISNDKLLLMGVMLYWAEGGKTRRMVRLANSDPRLIKIIMRFFREICQVPEEKFRCHIHIHRHLDYKQAEEYWSNISGIPLNKFYKTYRKPNKASQEKKDTLPYGTLDVYVLDTQLFYKIQGWTEGIYKKLS